jgi:transposase
LGFPNRRNSDSLALSLTGGNAHDITQAEPLAAQVEPEALLGDKGYDADSFITSLEVRAIKVVIPPKSTRKVKRACDFALYAERNLVERFFNAIKHYRGIATATKKPRATSLPDCTWSAHSLGLNDDRP